LFGVGRCALAAGEVNATRTTEEVVQRRTELGKMVAALDHATAADPLPQVTVERAFVKRELSNGVYESECAPKEQQPTPALKVKFTGLTHNSQVDPAV
jgi:hypothetical protein